ncbi:putative diguanylate cyclase DgcC [bioreactor metagenome]|uniref:Putative diguanylate cyclase DgcC n=1 Tax=bioreactor metagenome TaxID=1076179 RepID=A0A645EVU7_9ZZZZ
MLQQSLKLDELTGIFNRKALHDAMKNFGDYNPKEKHVFAIIDIDKFKSINDNWGHRTGDRCLIEFARILRENCGNAVPFRYGGDEFCLLFHDANIEESIYTCEQIRTELKNLDIGVDPKLEITASFGLAEYSDKINIAQLFINADQALYKAKILRNKIEVFEG